MQISTLRRLTKYNKDAQKQGWAEISRYARNDNAKRVKFYVVAIIVFILCIFVYFCFNIFVYANWYIIALFYFVLFVPPVNSVCKENCEK